MVKKTTLLSMLLVSFMSNAQQGKINFSYDEPGNQIIRTFCINCAGKNDDSAGKKSTHKDEGLLKFFPEDVISYYPNPVKEELFLKWEQEENKKVNSIAVFSISGALIKTYTDLDGIDTKTISFYDVSEGVYNVILYYSDGDQKSIKIIKK